MSNDFSNLAYIYNTVKSSGKPNYQQARIALKSGLNISGWKRELEGYWDSSLIDCLEFGFPLSYTALVPPTGDNKNHATAHQFPDHVTQYLLQERQHDALAGPFLEDPFTPWFTTSPLLTRAKRDSDKRRIIVDLSWPPGGAVNDGVMYQTWLGEEYKLKLPTTDNVESLITKHGTGSDLFSRDLSRAYGQLCIDPLDWPLLGIQWRGHKYFHLYPPFGSRVGAYCAQRVAEAMCHIVDRQNTLVFVDDFLGVNRSLEAVTHNFNKLKSKMDAVGLAESEGKEQPPSQSIPWIGINFNTTNMTMSIPERKVREAEHLVKIWLSRTSATRHELQQILGKLLHIAKCVKPAWLFTGACWRHYELLLTRVTSC